jgi:ligand-binding sensor domain-containing protein
MILKSRISKLIDKISRAYNINLYLIILIIIAPEISQAQRVNINNQYPVITPENSIWFGTPDGLLQYNRDNDSFKRIGISPDQTVANIKQLYYDDGILWCVTDTSLAALHIRLNEWLVYDKSNGLPSNSINGIAFTDDHVWTATDNGAARFDLLIEEWETFTEGKGFPSGTIYDIVSINDKPWLVSRDRLSEYDPYYERWRHYDIDLDSTFEISRGFLFAEDIWLIGNSGFIRFDPQMQTQQKFLQSQFSSDKLLELYIEDDLLWAVTQNGLFSFNQRTGAWKAFEGNSYLENTDLVNAYVDRSEIWVLFHNEIRIWNRADNSWDIIDYASGLSSSDYHSLYVDGGSAFLIAQEIIDYRLTKGDTWREYHLPLAKAPDYIGRQIFKELFDNEAGGHIGLGRYDWSWVGTRITFIRDHKKTIIDSSDVVETEKSSGKRLDIKSQFNLDEFRGVSGYYNDIDYSETEYGIRYRSRTDDYLRELNWGDYTLEAGDNPFGEEVRLFGSNIWLRAGPKTTRLKRSRFNLQAFTGEQQTRKTYEHYQGATNTADIDFADTEYLRRQFYAIPGVTGLSELENISVYVDDLDHTTNSLNTLIGHTIAGITGDFDLQIAMEHYYIYEAHDLIRFTGLIDSDYRIVAQYTMNGIQSEVVLQYDDGINTARQNVYHLGGSGIIPYSFKLEITDSTGNSIPIRDFRLDDNGDDMVDSEWIDYSNGLLVFPDEHPFPPEVYDYEQPQSFYRLHAHYQTDLSFIRLQNRNLVRGSEQLKLDGTKAAAGDDYVLDYTNGTLVFVREDAVSIDTRIEIEYQYYLVDYSEQVHSTRFAWSPGDDLLVESEWTRFSDDTDSLAGIVSKNLFSLSSEIRQNIAGFDLKMNPGLAYNTGEDKLAGVNWEGSVSSPRLRFQSVFRRFADGYKNLYRPRFTLGEIERNLQLNALVDVREDTRISGEWNEYRGVDNESPLKPKDRTAKIGLLFHRNLWPVWRFGYHDFQTKSSAGKSSKRYFQADLEYQLPGTITRKLSLHDIKLEASLRKGKQSGLSNLGSDESRFNIGHIRLNTLFSERFQGSFYYRREDQIEPKQEGRDNPMYRSERLFFDFDHEEWRVLQLYFRLENKITHNFHVNSDSRDINLSKSSQFNLRFSPGMIYQFLDMENFQAGKSSDGQYLEYQPILC